ncbi:MAG: ABC transporter permease [Spirochaetaceae bacterium]|jgi:simple sugar transport system permease protein|nr:ABC transporter permease [Spirochaetaceae bacterium]
MLSTLAGSIPSILMIVAPILIAAAGGMLCERSGVVNIALEGLMAMGAWTSAALHVTLERFVPSQISVYVALCAGALAGLAFSAIHAFACVSMKADQTVSGTGVNLTAGGLTLFLSQVFFNQSRTPGYRIGMLPFHFGQGNVFAWLFNGIYPTALIAALVVLAVWFVLYKKPFGLRLRACGEHPGAAVAAGVNVRNVRYFATLGSGLLAGLAGGCLVLTQTIQYTTNTINGTGFIALAVVAFGRWLPRGITLSSLLFGIAVAFSVVNIGPMQAIKAHVPSEFFNLLPYAVTLLALIAFSGKNYAPQAAGKP